MKTTTYTILATLFAAAPALAHNGAHLHPHGFEGLLVGCAVIAVAGGMALAKARMK